MNLGPFLLEKRGQTHYEGRVVNGSKAADSEGDSGYLSGGIDTSRLSHLRRTQGGTCLHITRGELYCALQAQK